jgi:aspartate/methionine/tyrosine aminotransferase
VNNIARVYGPRFNRELNPLTEVLVTLGANGALGAITLAMIEPGDEVIIIEPCFPLYFDHLRIS